jgi:hypothetical protein
MAHDVFISYSHKNKPIADAICAALEQASVRCWIAPRDIAPGLDWPTAISTAIAESRLMVLVFSVDSNASKDVSRELYLAANSNLIIIPFKIDATDPEPGKQYYLARTHWLDAMNPPTREQIDKLVGHVRSFTTDQAAIGTPQPAPAPAPAETGPPQPPVKPLMLQYSGPETARIVKRNKRASAWIWRGLVPLAILAAGVFALQFLGQTHIPDPPKSTPSLPMPTAVTPAPTTTTIPSITTTPTRTPRPTSSVTPIPAWVKDFAEPILNAVGNNSPDFTDDFSQASPNYQLWEWAKISEGALVYTTTGDTGWTYIPCCQVYHNFVLRVDVDMSGLKGENTAEVTYQNNADYSLDYEMKPDGRWFIRSAGNGKQPIPDPKKVGITLISYGTKYAFYINNIPVSSGENTANKNVTSIGFRAWSDGRTTAIAKFDNIQIWDLDSLPNLP